jgi:catechol 2,3-dioxygenase-like lactoylglutathione lyase family enzyme
VNFNQITIYTSKMAESVEFYEKLGLRLIVDALPRYVRFEFPEGGSTLSLHETNDSLNNSSIILYFECENLDTEVERLKNLSLKFDAEPEDKRWLWRESYLKDPNGNVICLFYAGENRQNPPWRVK